MAKRERQAVGARGFVGDVRSFLGDLYELGLHGKRLNSLPGATFGVMTAASLAVAVAVIGQALAQARGLVTKHAVKQVDRLPSNPGIDVWDSFARWVPHQIGKRQDILVAAVISRRAIREGVRIWDRGTRASWNEVAREVGPEGSGGRADPR